MQIDVYTIDGQKSGTMELPDEIFNVEPHEHAMHLAVKVYLANQRQGTHKTKTRSEVSGGGRKPWKQKGTGRARAGSIRSPIWRSGGVTFASKKRDYSQKINKKMYKRALRSIISELHRADNLIVVSDFQCSSLKTKDFISKMNEMQIKNALIVMSEVGEYEYLASRNLVDYDICDVSALDPVSLLRYEKVLITEDAIKKLEEQLL